MTVARGPAPLHRPASLPAVSPVVLRVLVALAAALVAAAIGLFAFRQSFDGRILPGVLVGGVDVGGMTPAEATSALAEGFGFDRGRLVLTSRLGDRSVSFGAVGREPDVESMVAAAVSAGRRGSPLDEAVAAVRQSLQPVRVEPAVRVDQSRIGALIDRYAEDFARSPVSASVVRIGDDFYFAPSEIGWTVWTDGLRESASAALLDPTAPERIEIAARAIPVRPRTGDAEAAAARAAAERIARDVTLTNGTTTWTMAASTIADAVHIGWSEGAYRPLVDPAGLTAALDPIASELGRAPRDAAFLLDRGGRIVGVRASRDGVALDPAATTRSILEVLETRSSAPTTEGSIAVTTVAVAPAFTTEQATRTAPLMAVMGSWTTRYEVGAHNGYGANITTPARRLNGTVVQPGELFDFWTALGEVSFRTGYRLGGAIIGGHSVEGTTLAGGICAASTTLFNAAVRGGYDIVARAPHWYYIKRYPLGLDATVSGSQFMRFRNDTRFPILIKGYASPGVITFEIWSVPNGRTVSWSKPRVTNVIRGYETLRETSELKSGQRERIEWAADGMDVAITRVVRDASGRVVHDDTFVSHYHRMIGVTLVGTG